MKVLEKTIDVGVPIRTAYNQWTQFEEFPRFMHGVLEVRQQGDIFLHWRVRIAGVTEEWEAEIVEQIPDKLIRWRSIGGAENSGEVRFEPVRTDSTRVFLRLVYEPDGILERIGDATGAIERRVEEDLVRFRTFIEARKFETGGWRGEVHFGQRVE